MFVRPLVADLLRALQRHGWVHVLVGARQTGKSTAARQIAARWRGPVVLASADRARPPGSEWIETHWSRARRAVVGRRGPTVLLVLDEAQKVRGWSEAVKALWEEDRLAGARVRALLLGSSALLVQQGLTESLAGRFLLHRCPHWSFTECEAAFGWNLDRWLFFGGYPGAAGLIRDEEAWRSYVADSLVETAIARDVLALQPVTKPALLRQLFGLAADHPAEILSYTKMVGTLHDAGNTVTLAHYLRLLDACFLVSGLERTSAGVRSRGSTPKIVLWNNALTNALGGMTFREARDQPDAWGRIVENAYGAHLLNHLPRPRFRVEYWRERNFEVDYVVTAGRKRVALEVKSGRPERPLGLEAFQRRFPSARAMLIGSGGIPLDEAFRDDPAGYLG